MVEEENNTVIRDAIGSPPEYLSALNCCNRFISCILLQCFRISEPPDLHYNMTLYDSADHATLETEVGPQLVHKYTITNKGPSGITEAEAYFVWPSFTFDGTY
jgi:hypothetical protein